MITRLHKPFVCTRCKRRLIAKARIGHDGDYIEYFLVPHRAKKQKRKSGAPVHESGYPLHVVRQVERAGWDVAQTTDGTGDWYAYWDATMPGRPTPPLAWASSCETIDAIYRGLTSADAAQRRKK